MFAAKCAVCHGTDLAKPKGRFGYVVDLARVAKNREMVVPGSPSESELWDLVHRGEMPPDDSPAGPLSARQKEVIRAWIAAGAPSEVASPAENLGPMAQAPEQAEADPPALPFDRHFLRWIGKFHLVLLHFPIALLVGAAIAECWTIVAKPRVAGSVIRFCVLFGATTAVVVAALGWLHALNGYGAGMPRILTLHRWLGTVTGLWLVATAAFTEWDARRGVRSMATRGLLLAGALLVGLTGHVGGILTHGEDFVDW